MKVLEKLESKLDAMDQRLDSVDKTLIKQEANLGEHMRRTELLEDAHRKQESKNEQNFAAVYQEIAPLKRHKVYMEGALKGIGIVVTLAVSIVSFAAAVIKIASFFHS